MLHQLDPEEAGEFGITMKKNENKPTLESEYKASVNC